MSGTAPAAAALLRVKYRLSVADKRHLQPISRANRPDQLPREPTTPKVHLHTFHLTSPLLLKPNKITYVLPYTFWVSQVRIDRTYEKLIMHRHLHHHRLRLLSPLRPQRATLIRAPSTVYCWKSIKLANDNSICKRNEEGKSLKTAKQTAKCKLLTARLTVRPKWRPRPPRRRTVLPDSLAPEGNGNRHHS